MSEFDFAVIARNLPYLWEGLQLSLMLAAISIAAGIVLGSLLASFACLGSLRSRGLPKRM